MPALAVQQLIADREQALRLLHEKKADNLTEEVYKEQKRYFARIDRMLDACQHGPDWLSRPAVAELVANRIKAADGKAYELIAYCIMSNHVHLVADTANQLDELQAKEAVTTKNYQQLYKTLGLIKGGSSFSANKLLNRTGAFWQSESYDHYVRNWAELQRIVDYVVQNPVKAGLVADWQDWPHTYLSERF